MKWFGKKFGFNNSRDPVPLHNRWRMTSFSTRSSWRTTGRRRRSRWRWPCPCSTWPSPPHSRIRRPHRRRCWTAFPTSRLTIVNKAAKPRVYHLQHRKGMRVRTTIFSGLPGTPAFSNKANLTFCMFWGTREGSYFITVHCKKGLTIFPTPAGKSITKLSLTGNNLIIPGQGRVLIVTYIPAGTGKFIN